MGADPLWVQVLIALLSGAAAAGGAWAGVAMRLRYLAKQVEANTTDIRAVNLRIDRHLEHAHDHRG